MTDKMAYYTNKIKEIADLFRGVSKSVKSLNGQDIITLGRHTVENPLHGTCGLELKYKTQANPHTLSIYVVMQHKKNSAGRSYPHDLIVAADFKDKRLENMGEFFGAYMENETEKSPFLFISAVQDSHKRTRFDDVSKLEEGTGIKELMCRLDRRYFNE